MEEFEYGAHSVLGFGVAYGCVVAEVHQVLALIVVVVLVLCGPITVRSGWFGRFCRLLFFVALAD